MRLKLICAVLLLAPLTACADPITVFATLLPYIGATAAGIVATVVSYSAYITVGVGIARAASARRKARRAAARQRAAYNAGLTDRSLTALSNSPPLRVIYGEAVTGGDIVAIFTSDKVGVRLNPFEEPRVKRDGYKHLVVVFAGHEVEQIDEVYLDGQPLGALDSGGWVTSGEFYTDAKERAHIVTFTGSLTVPYEAGRVLGAYDAAYNAVSVTLSADRKTFTGPPGVQVNVQYVSYIGNAAVACRKHLGMPGDTADAYLQSVAPEQWTSAHLLRGCAYVVLTLDLEQQRFQAGPPGITARIRGRRVYDPRKDSTRGGAGTHRLADPSTWQWTNNPALCVRDWLCAPWGYECDPIEDIDEAYTIAAANACEVVIPIGQIPASGSEREETTGPMYTCNGVLTTDGSREAQLEELCESMVGDAVYGAKWMIIAGAWTAPVAALTDADLHGQIEIVQAGASMEELFNGIRGTYIPAGKAQPIDFEPYSNPTFVASDGRPLWTNAELGFVNDKQRCKIIARILTERARSSQVIKYPAKLPAWRLRVGERVTVSSDEYGFPAKPYRVTDWQFGLDAPVTLLLEEDAAEIWDLADAVVADPTPNSNLPSPWRVAEVEGVTAASGTEHLQLQADGTIVSRVWVSWDPIDDAYVTTGGRVRVRWLGPGERQWHDPVETTGDATGVYLTGMRDRDPIAIEVVAINALGRIGPEAYISHFVVGKTAAPANVTGLVVTVGQAGVQIRWAPNNEGDYRRTRLRLGSSWDSYSVEYLVAGNSHLIPFLPVGNYTVFAKHEDTTRHVSVGTASASFTVTPANQVQWANVVGRPKLYRAVAGGNGSSNAPHAWGLYDGETDALLASPTRSYRMVAIARDTGAIVHNQTYDVFGNGEVDGRGAADLASDLNYFASQAGPVRAGRYILVIVTADEPSANRFNGGLLDAMLRNGASRAVFGSPQFRFRSAYVLIAISGIGEGGGFEAYQGAVDNDPNAWVDVAFQVASGQLLVTGMGATPRSLADYSYIGALDATKGATFGVDINGQAQTNDIAPNAATVVAQQYVAGPVTLSKTPPPGPYGDVIAAITYTATEACTAQLTAAGVVVMTTNLAQTFVSAQIFDFASGSGNFPDDTWVVRNKSTNDPGEHFGVINRLRTFSMSAGETRTFSLMVFFPFGTSSSEVATVRAASLRLEVIKR